MPIFTLLSRTDRGSGSVLAWGVIHSQGRTCHVMLNGTFSVQSDMYEVIQPKVVSYVPGHGLTFQQKNTGPHSAGLTE